MKRRLVTIAAVVAVALSACGVPTDDEPRSIPQGQVPFDLLTPSTTQPPTTTPIETVPVSVFMIRGDRLAPVLRSVPAPPTLGSILAALIQGPTDEEAAEGLSSSVTPQSNVLGAQVQGSIATVEISGDVFESLGTQDQIRALAQIVYSATSVPEVASVQFRLNNANAGVPRGDGSTTTGPVRREDYGVLAPA